MPQTFRVVPALSWTGSWACHKPLAVGAWLAPEHASLASMQTFFQPAAASLLHRSCRVMQASSWLEQEQLDERMAELEAQKAELSAELLQCQAELLTSRNAMAAQEVPLSWSS